MNKKIIYIGLSAIFLTATLLGGYFIFSKTKNKSLILIVDKIYTAYSGYISDIGASPNSIKDLYISNQSPRWQGPYISEKILKEYSDGDINIIKASLIPTKKCSINSIINCFTWIVVNNADQGMFEQTKNEILNPTQLFYANNKLYFKITKVE